MCGTYLVPLPPPCGLFLPTLSYTAVFRTHTYTHSFNNAGFSKKIGLCNIPSTLSLINQRAEDKWKNSALILPPLLTLPQARSPTGNKLTDLAKMNENHNVWLVWGKIGVETELRKKPWTLIMKSPFLGSKYSSIRTQSYP